MPDVLFFINMIKDHILNVSVGLIFNLKAEVMWAVMLGKKGSLLLNIYVSVRKLFSLPAEKNSLS